ncbi:MAG TPA: response regulator [Aggregatilineales bacterium]|jgi:CheY-like chemotaxis protein|nr:response regulator [Aggregatilineales bacterium]
MMKDILIAEDNGDLRAIFARVFEHSDYNVRVATDGQETIQQLTEAVPDMLILDINMPRVSGLDVLSHIKDNPAYARMKKVIVTGNFLAQHEPEAAFADAFLVKPVSIADLVKLSEQLLSDS